jgi:hypothetical protein
MLEHYSTQHGVTPLEPWLPPFLQFSLPLSCCTGRASAGSSTTTVHTPGLVWRFHASPDSVPLGLRLEVEHDTRFSPSPPWPEGWGREMGVVLMDEAVGSTLLFKYGDLMAAAGAESPGIFLQWKKIPSAACRDGHPLGVMVFTSEGDARRMFRDLKETLHKNDRDKNTKDLLQRKVQKDKKLKKKFEGESVTPGDKNDDFDIEKTMAKFGEEKKDEKKTTCAKSMNKMKVAGKGKTKVTKEDATKDSNKLAADEMVAKAASHFRGHLNPFGKTFEEYTGERVALQLQWLRPEVPAAESLRLTAAVREEMGGSLVGRPYLAIVGDMERRLGQEGAAGYLGS